MGGIVNKWQKILTSKIKDIIKKPNEIIYQTNIPLDGRDTQIRSTQTNLGQIITKAMSFAYNDNVDCAIVNGGSIRIDDQLSGNINAVDIFRGWPSGGAGIKVEIEGRLLKRVLDYGGLAKSTGAYLQRFNVENTRGKWSVKNKE